MDLYNGWIKTSECPPETGKMILGCNKFGEIFPGMMREHPEGNGIYWVSNEDPLGFGEGIWPLPLYWMPYPSPPPELQRDYPATSDPEEAESLPFD